MEHVGWYCPKCDKLTNTRPKCKTCGTALVWQRFQCWPIPPTLDDEYFIQLYSPRVFDKKKGEMVSTVKKYAEFMESRK